MFLKHFPHSVANVFCCTKNFPHSVAIFHFAMSKFYLQINFCSTNNERCRSLRTFRLKTSRSKNIFFNPVFFQPHFFVASSSQKKSLSAILHGNNFLSLSLSLLLSREFLSLSLSKNSLSLSLSSLSLLFFFPRKYHPFLCNGVWKNWYK
jgi:hypothetical protein